MNALTLQLNGHRAMPAPTENRQTTRVEWTEDEVDALTTELLKQFLATPFGAMTKMIENAQRTVLPEHRQRNLSALANSPALANGFMRKWREFVDSASKDPMIIEVEKTVTPSFQDILGMTDIPTLQAAIAWKREEKERVQAERLNAIMLAVAEKLGAQAEYEQAGIAATRKSPLLIEATKRKLKVVILGPQKDQFDKIVEKATAQGLTDVFDLVWENHDNRERSVSCNFIVMTRFVRKGWYEKASKDHGSNLKFVPNGGIEAVFGKLIDLNSQLRH
jgi:hypothetical protein